MIDSSALYTQNYGGFVHGEYSNLQYNTIFYNQPYTAIGTNNTSSIHYAKVTDIMFVLLANCLFFKEKATYPNFKSLVFFTVFVFSSSCGCELKIKACQIIRY